MRGWRSLLPIIVFTALYAAVSLSVTNSYYQLVMTLVPVWASESKFSVSGTPNDVMLPPFVRANVGSTMRKARTAASSMAHTISARMTLGRM